MRRSIATVSLSGDDEATLAVYDLATGHVTLLEA